MLINQRVVIKRCRWRGPLCVYLYVSPKRQNDPKRQSKHRSAAGGEGWHGRDGQSENNASVVKSYFSRTCMGLLRIKNRDDNYFTSLRQFAFVRGLQHVLKLIFLISYLLIIISKSWVSAFGTIRRSVLIRKNCCAVSAMAELLVFTARCYA